MLHKSLFALDYFDSLFSLSWVLHNMNFSWLVYLSEIWNKKGEIKEQSKQWPCKLNAWFSGSRGIHTIRCILLANNSTMIASSWSSVKLKNSQEMCLGFQIESEIQPFCTGKNIRKSQLKTTCTGSWEVFTFRGMWILWILSLTL